MKLSPLVVLALALCASASPGPVGDGYAEAAAATRALWEPWLEQKAPGSDLEKRYSPHASADGRVVIFTPRGTSYGKLLRSSKKTVTLFDKLFPPQLRGTSATPRRSAALFPLAGPKSFESVTAAAAKLAPGLSEWARAAARGVGFLLEDPLAAGWLLKVPSSEVWNVENELVNRLARLLTIERFGRQPHWLAQGLAWHVEQRVCKDVYCFPYRTGFIAKKEHKSWAKRLPLAMQERSPGSLTMADLHGWRRNSWSAQSAALASGAVDMLTKHYSREFPAVLEAFARLREKDGRDTQADGSWTLRADYEIPAEQQQSILDRELGVDFLIEFERYARSPKHYRRPR